jgi:hypothetical protein
MTEEISVQQIFTATIITRVKAVVYESVSLQNIVKRYAGLLNYSRQLWARKPHPKSSAANKVSPIKYR